MNPLEHWLNKLETHLQKLVEGTADQVLSVSDAQHGPQLIEDLSEQTAPLNIEPATALHPLPEAAFLVVDGVRLFPLEKPLISIGRSPENDLVVPDIRVSRQHAQLRAVNGYYIIFDLDSTGGTSLNGQPVVQHLLSPGDVISLAGVPLVYGQEIRSGTELTQELTL